MGLMARFGLLLIRSIVLMKTDSVSFPITTFSSLWITSVQRVRIILTMRDIQKISSVCEYCRCSAAVTMVRKHAEFLDSLLRHGRNLKTSEQCLHIVLCVYNV